MHSMGFAVAFFHRTTWNTRMSCNATQGFSENIRSEAWKFLLHMYPFNSTSDQRRAIDRNKTFVQFFLKHIDMTRNSHTHAKQCGLSSAQNAVEVDAPRAA